MKKIISSLLVFFLFFLSFSPTFTEDSKNYEKNLIKKELILKHTELAKTTN
jgi:hypothetical protein